MKKLLLIIAITFLIFQMVVLATVIDIGDLATNRNSYLTKNHTFINKGTPATGTGKITNVDIWAYNDMSGIIVAIFTEVDTNIFTARDSQAVANITAGSAVSRTVDLDVVTGDFIGLYWYNGMIEEDTYGGAGRWYLSGNQTSCVDTEFNFYGDHRMSIRGTGATEEEEEVNAIFFGTNF